MITRELYLTVGLAESASGRTELRILKVLDRGEIEEVAWTGYSDASLLLEEAGSLIDAILFHWLARFGQPTIPVATG